jgi:hypothetical protein
VKVAAVAGGGGGTGAVALLSCAVAVDQTMTALAAGAAVLAVICCLSVFMRFLSVWWAVSVCTVNGCVC